MVATEFFELTSQMLFLEIQTFIVASWQVTEGGHALSNAKAGAAVPTYVFKVTVLRYPGGEGSQVVELM